MRLSVRRARPVVVLFAAILLAACGQFNPGNEEPTPPRVVTLLVVASPVPSPTIPDTPTPQATPSPTPTVKPVPKDPYLPVYGPFPPIPVPSRPANLNPLTGQPADPLLLQRRPILVRIGNDQKVRTSGWQAGFTAADLVFEELIDMVGASFANTRYTAVYLSNDAPLIGPVRSGRLINLQIAPMLDGALSHAGASNGTRWLFSQTPMVNLDEFFNMPGYCYVNSHGYMGRLYTTGPRLRQWLTQKGWEKPIPLYGFAFSESAPVGQPVKSVALIKSPWPKWAQVEWRFDPATGQYARFVTGTAMTDNSYPVTAKWGNGPACVASGPTQKMPVQAANVVVLQARHDKTKIIEDSNNAVSAYISLTGQGDAQLFRDGSMIQARWNRRSEQEFFRFTDSSGKEVSLKPGKTWFEIVPLGYSLDLK